MKTRKRARKIESLSANVIYAFFTLILHTKILDRLTGFEPWNLNVKATVYSGNILHCLYLVLRIDSGFVMYVWLGYGLKCDKVKGISCFSNIASWDGCAYIRVLPQGEHMKGKCMLV